MKRAPTAAMACRTAPEGLLPGLALMMLGFFALLVLLLRPAEAASSTLQPQEVLDLLQQSRQQVSELDAKAKFGFRLKVGPIPYRETLDGSYRYRAPDEHKLDFPNAPSYLQGLPNAFSWELPELAKYRSAIKGPVPLESSQVYLLTLVPKSEQSQVQSLRLTVDSKNWHLLRQETSYRDGGSVDLFFTYQVDLPYPVVEEVRADLVIPSYSLKGDARLELTPTRIQPKA